METRHQADVIIAGGGTVFVGPPLQKLLGVKGSTAIAFHDWCNTADFSEDDDLPPCKRHRSPRPGRTP